MKKIIVYLILSNILFAQNKYPIVLIHGFFGWGNNEMGDYRYWGGKKDIQKMLEEKGFKVFTVSVGPISSNWDRAVEVYYQLKGGQVDYGLNHSKKYGLEQRPTDKIYNGLYPEWSSENPVHLVGHSMGGQTARMLQYLLENEIFIDDSLGFIEDSDLLGKSKEGWVSSITSLATPHDGSTLTDIVTKTFPFIQYFIGVAGVVGTNFYDFDLSQWNINRKDNENWYNYVQRMRSHNAWGTKNISSWDLSLDGASELNSFLNASPDVYYFSYSFSATSKDEETGYHVPNKDVFLLIRSRAKLLGSRVVFTSNGNETDSTWWENDGIVNSRSMNGPTTGQNGADAIVNYDQSVPIIQGQWYTFESINLDHYQSVGHMLPKGKRNFLDSIYINHAQLLWSLPEY
ncbi:MAG: lipase [Candidatus Marinimicrobia bacterium]|nr:lipase [Candidatus Neomarinimicrobiota bacterium]